MTYSFPLLILIFFCCCCSEQLVFWLFHDMGQFFFWSCLFGVLLSLEGISNFYFEIIVLCAIEVSSLKKHDFWEKCIIWVVCVFAMVFRCLDLVTGSVSGTNICLVFVGWAFGYLLLLRFVRSWTSCLVLGVQSWSHLEFTCEWGIRSGPSSARVSCSLWAQEQTFCRVGSCCRLSEICGRS